MTIKELNEQEIKPVAYLIEWGADKIHPTGKRLSFGPSFAPEDVCNELYHESTVTTLRAEIERLKKQLEPAQIDEQLKKDAELLVNALEFYANRNHTATLRGKIDWPKHRQQMKDAGFEPYGELYDGTEMFVESGIRAQDAIDAWQARTELERERIK